MKNIVKSILNRTSHYQRLNIQIEKQGAFPAGHFYSPIPEKEDILCHLKSNKETKTELPGINLNKDEQLILLNEYTQFYDELPFAENKNTNCRYYYNNKFFGPTDAIFLYSFLKKFTPKKIIEIGSGFSSAVILDTVDQFYPTDADITFIDPFADRLKSLLREKDNNRVEVIEKRVQDVSIKNLTSLEQGDFLFIDSSHVVKCGSDLQFLMFEILPILSPGVFVHFHDIFFPFEYPLDWVTDGRYWNENYFLRAFLTFNSKWDILFFNNYVSEIFSDIIRDKMPKCVGKSGGSIYIQRTG